MRSPFSFSLFISIAAAARLCERGYMTAQRYHRRKLEKTVELHPSKTTLCFVAWNVRLKLVADNCTPPKNFILTEAFASSVTTGNAPESLGCWVSKHTMFCLCPETNCNNFLNWRHFLTTELDNGSLRSLNDAQSIHREIFGKTEMVSLNTIEEKNDIVACLLKRYLNTYAMPPKLRRLRHVREAAKNDINWILVLALFAGLIAVKLLMGCYYYYLWNSYRSGVYSTLFQNTESNIR
ncbi:unnamed protein product [Cylicocyclus nassatus]|uniref:Uncharacterized protein n=1 Tax=Cylicocyclus nassatus TaxID=53992 RepID=A0AA36H4S8_CYLNA|nr:unnamed protein product [Cylicocyclus nassatus]